MESFRLRHDPLKAELTGVAEYGLAVLAFEMLVELSQRERRAELWTINQGMAAANPYARKIWFPVFRNLDSADIGVHWRRCRSAPYE